MNNPDHIYSKIVASEQLREMNRAGKMVFTNGCFDILHAGHIDYLSRAADLGDFLVVGLNSDKSVRRLKGENRPVQDEKARARILASLFFVDYVTIFNEDTPYNLIKILKPDILVKGGDYKAEDIVGYDLVKASGGEVLTLNFLEGHSSSDILRKIK